MKRNERQLHHLVLLLAAGLLTGCSTDDATDTPPANISEIRMTVGEWQVMQGTTRATFLDGDASLTAAGSFTVYAYTDGGTTPLPNLDGKRVEYGSGVWDYEPKQTWPPTDAVNFFAYMPHDVTASDAKNTCITIGEYANRNPKLVCTNLPLDKSGQDALQEFIYAYAQEQTRAAQGASGVDLRFFHPLARINVVLSVPSAGVTVNSITFKSIKQSGTASISSDGTTVTTAWTPSGDAKDLSIPVSENTPTGLPYLVLPQTFTDSKLTIAADVTRTNWGTDDNATLTANVTMSDGWQPGYSYTYTLTVTATDLTVSVDKFTQQW